MDRNPEVPSRAVAARVGALSMRYGDKTVLDGVDLTLYRGELFALLGPNGAGKTTMIEILEGYRRRSSGEVEVLGRDPQDDDAAWRARIGIVLQSSRDHARWRVGEMMEHFAKYWPDPWPAGELAEAVGLAPQWDQPLSLLSGGQRRRLDVALGLLGRPDLLFLDEPTTGLDPEGRRDFHALLLELRRVNGMTVLLTTHDMSEAQDLADRIGILREGRLIALGTVPELAEQARSGSQVRWVDDAGQEHAEVTSDPSRRVFELHQGRTTPVPSLEVRQPTLEDTYLDMVGSPAEPAGSERNR